MTAPANLRHTVLHSAHVSLGAKMAPFGGWDMPVVYSSIVEEHQAVRQRVGLFDVSHMGELFVAGPQAETFLNRLLTNDVRQCPTGGAQYTLLCNERGGIVDDLIFYRLETTRFLLLVNAANVAGDWAWINAQPHDGVQLENRADEIAAIALQGPFAPQLLPAAAGLGSFQIGEFDVAGCRCWIARTGYTGEDGFEILCPTAKATQVWQALLAQGARPCGLGARDTLRLEMCYPLHGSDINADTTPLEAGLGRFVALDKPDFIGRAALLEQKAAGLKRKLVPFKITEKAPPPRAHYPLLAGDRAIGEVTSGAPSPTLGIGVGMGYVEPAFAAPGTAISVAIRGKTFPATVSTKPLYKKSK